MTEEVSQVAGVTGVEVDLASGAVTVTSEAPVDAAPSAPPSTRPATRWSARDTHRHPAVNTPLKLAGFAVGLVAVFGAAAGRRRAPSARSGPAPADAAPTAAARRRGDGARGRPRTGRRRGELPGGLQVTAGRLHPGPVADDRAGRRRDARSPSGSSARTAQPVTGYTPSHDKDLHLIVVRRDLSGFQHVHPSWPPTAPGRPADAGRAGQYRVFADFQPAADGESADARRRPAGRRRLPARAAARRRRGPPTSTATPSPSTATSTPGAESKLTLGEQGRQAGHRPAALPRRRTATWSRCATATSPTCTSTRTSERRRRGPGVTLLRRGPRPPAPTGCSWTSSTAASSAPPSSPSPPARTAETPMTTHRRAAPARSSCRSAA